MRHSTRDRTRAVRYHDIVVPGVARSDILQVEGRLGLSCENGIRLTPLIEDGWVSARTKHLECGARTEADRLVARLTTDRGCTQAAGTADEESNFANDTKLC